MTQPAITSVMSPSVIPPRSCFSTCLHFPPPRCLSEGGGEKGGLAERVKRRDGKDGGNKESEERREVNEGRMKTLDGGKEREQL